MDITYFAGFEFNDIENKLVFDLGCGTGRLSIASIFLKAFSVISVDVDWNALKILQINVKNLNLNDFIFPLCANMKYFNVSKLNLPKNLKITTIMNPPFGIKTIRADRIFLEKAFSFSNVVYSIHLSGEKIRKFLTKYVKRFNWRIDNIYSFNMRLEKSFYFHSQKSKDIDVDLYRIIKN